MTSSLLVQGIEEDLKPASGDPLWLDFKSPSVSLQARFNNTISLFSHLAKSPMKEVNLANIFSSSTLLSIIQLSLVASSL